MGMVRQIYVSKREAGWYVSTPLDRAGPFLGDLDAAVFALALAYRAPPADVVLHVATAAPVGGQHHPARQPGPRPAEPSQLRTLASLLHHLAYVFDDDELDRATCERWNTNLQDLTARQADEWIAELTPGARR